MSRHQLQVYALLALVTLSIIATLVLTSVSISASAELGYQAGRSIQHPLGDDGPH